MPITYSVQFTDSPNFPLPTTAFYSSLTTATTTARDFTSEGGEATIRQHTADKASMPVILDALNATGWAALANGQTVAQIRNGKKVKG